MQKVKLVLIFIYTLLISFSVFAKEDNLLKTIDIAASGMQFQSERLKVVSENIANELTTGVTPASKPYKRKIIFAKNKFDRKLKTRVIKVRKYSEDNKTDFKIKYDPSNPAADEYGYVKYPNVNKEIELMDAMEAKKTYEANLGMIDLTKTMINKTIGIIE